MISNNFNILFVFAYVHMCVCVCVQTDGLNENMSVQMAHPGVIIQTVTSDLCPSEPLEGEEPKEDGSGEGAEPSDKLQSSTEAEGTTEELTHALRAKVQIRGCVHTHTHTHTHTKYVLCSFLLCFWHFFSQCAIFLHACFGWKELLNVNINVFLHLRVISLLKQNGEKCCNILGRLTVAVKIQTIFLAFQTLDSPALETPAVDSGITEGAVLIVPSPNSFIPTSDNITDDISTESVLPLGTLTGNTAMVIHEQIL